MNVLVVYILPLCPGRYEHFGTAYSKRFAQSYRTFTPGYNHSLVVVCNCDKPNDDVRNTFNNIPCIFVEGDNIGWDIGAYQCVAHSTDADMMLCLGSSSHFKRSGWLKRMVDVFQHHGPNLYGAMASQEITPHIRTIGFWFPPELLRNYPHEIVSYDDRHEFEHGLYSFTTWAELNGYKARMVTWSGIYDKSQWNNTVKNGFRNGNQSECLVFDNFTDRHEGK